MKGKQETKQFPQTPVIKHAWNFKDHPTAYVPTSKVSKGHLLMFSERKEAALAVTTFHILVTIVAFK